MAARLNEETTKIHVHLFAKDVEKIDAMFCRQGLRTIGRSMAIRLIVRSYLQALERKTNVKPIQFDPEIAELLNDE